MSRGKANTWSQANLPGGLLEGHGAVEYEVVSSRVLVLAIVAQALELQTIEHLQREKSNDIESTETAMNRP